LLVPLLASAAEARDKGTRLVSSSGGAVSFEVTVPAARIVPVAGGAVRVVIDGYGTFSPAGAIELPGAAFRIAIPPLGEPRVTATVLEEESLGPLNLARVAAERFVKGQDGMGPREQYYPPDPWANGGGLQLVEARPASFMGRQRVLPVRINPLIIDASGARLVRKLSITVSFGSAGTQTGVGDLAQTPVSGTWKHIYDELLVNPDDVSKLRKPLARVQVAMAPGEAGKRLKIRIPETGIYSIRADSLIAAGLSPGLATGEIALKKYYYDETVPDLLRKVDVPILVVESPSTAPGVFDGADRIIFYALGIKDDTQAGDTDALYTNDNVFWLEEGVAGALMNQGPPPPATLGDAITRFTATMKFRKDVWYMKNAVPGTHDFYFAKAPDLKTSAVTFTLHHPAPDGTFSLTLRLQGDDPNGYAHTVSFSVRNSTGTHLVGTASFTGKATKTFSYTGLSSSWLVDGQNDLVFVCDADYMYLINDFTMDYTALFMAHGDELEFAVDQLVDPRTIEITGFAVNSGWLIDVTNPQNPLVRALSPADFAADGTAYKLELALDEDFSARSFIALGADAGDVIAVHSVSVDTPSHLRESTGPYQALIVSHEDFIQRIGEYAAMRVSQGYRLMTADVQDVYDEFNGGLPNANAIKRYITYGLNHWGVEYVLLVGDASEDHKRLYLGANPDLQGSPPDFVPSYTYSTSVSGTYDDEVICSDKWYAFVDETLPIAAAAGVSATDILQGDGYPDVIIGRLPVGRDVELRALLSKINRMETALPDDAWRRRIVLFADDAWSGRGSGYVYNSYEQAFQDSTEACGAAIESALPGGFDVQRLYLAQYTDP
ncbi:MAG: C25 family cysteine peptidase, partial [Candidatus Krumholzibacteriaceae bacterium]